jgi:protein TonB
MEAKKTVEANLENQRSLFLLLGFVLVLGVLYIAFEWTDHEVTVYQATSGYAMNMDEEEIIQTQMDTPPPPEPIAPPPPAVIPEIVIVDKPVDTKTDIFVETSDVILPPPPAPTKIIDEPDDKVIYDFVQKPPTFPGGTEALYKFLSKEIVYPASAIEEGVKGRVICQFVVNTDGSIVDVVVVKGVDPRLDNEAIRVIKLMPKWTPGENNTKKVRVKYTLPIVFSPQS